ncbi:MAG: 30S ribosomal protein S7 [Verrucomicrobia bacterium]|nr:30S ribosomal protein S7 [Verrucomicrobiota bacterium]MCH8513465.1 30S ribosomal protein S7 [Kiritimatiellia bacterium]
MARRHRSVKRESIPDPKFQSTEVSHFVNQLMRDGKKSIAQKVFYTALEQVEEKTSGNALEVFENAIENVRPQLEVKSRRVGGATYQVPMELSAARSRSLAMRWIIQYAKARKGVPMAKALSIEIVDAYNNTGASVKKRDDTHKMAQANRAFAHYRW